MNDFRSFFSQGPKRVIASIFPIALKAERPFTGKTVYVLPAAETQSDIRTVAIENGFEHVYVGNGKYTDQPVFADDIARDVAHEWSSGYVGQESGLGPGVWLCDGDVPTMEEIEAARAKQTAYFEHLVNQANGLFYEGKANDISDLHRKAAKWLGYESVEWLNKMQQKALKECQHCFSKIDSRASVCSVCTRDVDAAAAKLRKGEKVAA